MQIGSARCDHYGVWHCETPFLGRSVNGYLWMPMVDNGGDCHGGVGALSIGKLVGLRWHEVTLGKDLGILEVSQTIPPLS